VIGQAVILVFSGAAIALLSSPQHHVRRWAFPIGLVAQPFWLISTWTAGQWGMFALTVVWTLSYLYGAWRHFWGQS